MKIYLISYSVITFECQYKIDENYTFEDQGYLSDFDEMSQKSDEIFVSCGRKEEKSRRRRGGEKALPPPAKILTTQGKVSPNVKIKTSNSNSIENHLKTTKIQSFQNMSSQPPLYSDYQDQLKFKIENYVLNFKGVCEKVHEGMLSKEDNQEGHSLDNRAFCALSTDENLLRLKCSR